MMKHWILSAAVLACAAPAWAAPQPPQWTAARIVKIEPEKARVTLKHQRIKSIGMEAMTMPFKVAEAVPLARFKVGDRVRFTVSTHDDHLLVDAMEAAK
jgi:Cu(I)/Ag(I) efflux system protein CusF